MNPLRLQALFHEALALPAARRRAFVDEATAGDDELQRELAALLALDDELGERTLKSIVPELGRLLSDGVAPGPGLRVGPFELRETIGSGGMGRVFRAERIDGSVAQTVAIKFVHRDRCDDDLLRRFRRERQLLAALEHPNIARLLDAAELPDGTPYVVMEFVDGEPITRYCERHGLGLRPRIELFRRACSAVAEAHRKLVVHCDLKPGNLLVGPGGEPKLLDFGIAKPLGVVSDESTRTAQRYFSPLYAAPEQLSGTATGVACDVYGLGLLLYELLAGRRPFDFRDLSAGQIERLVLETPPPAPSVAAGGGGGIPARQLRGELDDIVLRCLRKAPEERYPSVERLEADLANYLVGRPVEARGGHHWYRVRKFIGRHRAVVALGTLMLAVLVGASALLLRQNLQLVRERDRSRYAMQLLSDSFAAADPGQVAGGAVSARQVLDAAAPRIEETFEARPDIYVDLAATVARIQFNLGLWPQSAGLAGRAEAAARRAGLSATDVGRLRILQAMALVDAGQVRDADRLLGDGTGDGLGDLPEWQLARGHVLVNQNHPAEAIAVLTRALASVEDRPATDVMATQVRWELAAAQRAAELDRESLATLDRTLEWQRATLPEANSRVLLTRQRRIVALRDTGEKQSALAESQAVLDRIVADFGTGSAFTADARMNLGRGYNDARRYDEAAAQFRQAHDTFAATLGERHPRSVRSALNLAEVLSQVQGQSESAETWYRRALDDGTAGLGAESPTVSFFRLRYANFLLARERPREALGVLSAAPERASLPRLPADTRAAHARLLRDALSLACAGPEADRGPDCVAGRDALAAAGAEPPT